MAGELAANLKVGTWRSWHPNGQLRSEETFAADGVLGGVLTWFASGSKESEAQWRGGAAVSGTLWYESGDLKEKGASQDGLLESWYDGGQLKFRGELASGQRTGPWLFFRPDGTPDEEMSGQYEVGQRRGPL
mgnify:CR=1 FL=1